MVVIDKIKSPTPFFTYKPKPTFNTEIERQRYWAKEKERWINGYSEDVNGMLYFYATQIKLKNRITGEIFRPTVRDADVLIFNELKKSMDEGLSPFIIKGRGVGLSSIGMNLPFYFFRTSPNSKCIATSRDKKTLATLFNDKTIVAYDELDSDLKFDLINKNQTSSESFLKVGMKYKVDDNEKYAQSEFLCRDSQDSDKAATGFSGAGAIFGFADEAPLMPRFSKFFNSARECFIDHSINRMAGLLLSGGTVEDTIPIEGLQRIQSVYEAGKVLNIKPVFVPATYGKHMVNGHSDHKRAKEEIEKRREELDRLDDKSDLKAYIKNNPLDIQDIFDLAQGNSRWEDYTKERINIRVKELKMQTKPTYPLLSYNIVELNGEMVANPAKNGYAKILELPKKDVKYVLGLDATQSSDETSSKGSTNSKFSIYVMKGIDPQSDLQFCPVAKMTERPKDFDTTFDRGIRLLKFYNQFGMAKMTGERNATGGVFASKLLKDPILKKCVMSNWNLTKKKGSVETDKPFFYRNDETIDWQFIVANTYFKKYVESCWILDLLHDCQKPDNANTDDLDAFLACLYGWGTGDLLGDRPPERLKRKIGVMTGRDENGREIWKYFEG